MTSDRDRLRRRTRAACLALAVLVIGFRAIDACAQPHEPQPSLCFKIIPVRQNAQPEGAFLLNRCTGQTWLLTRIERSAARARRGAVAGFRWTLLAGDEVDLKRPAPGPEVQMPAPVRPGTEKCFTFQGRQFCE
jgi:hypothetical protein